MGKNEDNVYLLYHYYAPTKRQFGCLCLARTSSVVAFCIVSVWSNNGIVKRFCSIKNTYYNIWSFHTRTLEYMHGTLSSSEPTLCTYVLTVAEHVNNG